MTSQTFPLLYFYLHAEHFHDIFTIKALDRFVIGGSIDFYNVVLSTVSVTVFRC